MNDNFIKKNVFVTINIIFIIISLKSLSIRLSTLEFASLVIKLNLDEFRNE